MTIQIEYEAEREWKVDYRPIIEEIVVAAGVAVKAAHVEVGFMDRFCGTLILTGGFTEVMTAVEEVVRFFHETLKFDVCKIHRS